MQELNTDQAVKQCKTAYSNLTTDFKIDEVFPWVCEDCLQPKAHSPNCDKNIRNRLMYPPSNSSVPPPLFLPPVDFSGRNGEARSTVES